MGVKGGAMAKARHKDVLDKRRLWVRVRTILKEEIGSASGSVSRNTMDNFPQLTRILSLTLTFPKRQRKRKCKRTWKPKSMHCLLRLSCLLWL